MAESRQPAVLDDSREAPEPTPGDVLQEHPLDGVLVAVAENPLQIGALDDSHGDPHRTDGVVE